MDQSRILHPLDCVIAVLALIVPVVIGIVIAYKDANRMTRLEYLLGGQRFTYIPVAMSSFATFVSAIAIIGVPNEVYTFGTEILFSFCGMGLSYVVLYHTFVPVMYPLQVTSMYEYLYLRFQSQAVRMLSTIIGCVQTIFYLSLVLLSPALAVQAVVGMPMWMSVLLVGIVGTSYTVLGGMKSVIWTDVFQTVIFLIGILAIIIKGFTAAGGASNVWTIASDGGRLRFADFSIDPRNRLTKVGAVIGGMFLWLSLSYNQAMLQRVRSLKTMRHAKLSQIVIVPFFIVIGSMLTLVGIITYAFFSYTKCDPLKAGLITNSNQVTPYFVLRAMNDLPGMAGLYMATLACGALSTLSSGINALAANTVEDILERPMKNVSERTATKVTKIAAAVFGVLVCCIGYIAQYLQGPVTEMATSVFSAFGTPIFGMFFIGSAVPWVNKYGAIAGGGASMAFSLWQIIGARFYGRKQPTLPPPSNENCFKVDPSFISDVDLSNNHFNTSGHNSSLVDDGDVNVLHDSETYPFSLLDVSYEWYPVCAFIVCLFVGLAVSYCTQDKMWRSSRHNHRLLFPISRRLWSLETGEDIHEFDSMKMSCIQNPVDCQESI